jgi:hypothetical protein
VCALRATAIGAAVVVQEPSAGSYTSALESRPPASCPPATRTLPEGSSVAVCQKRAEAMASVVVDHEPSAGSYTSALER